MYAILWPDSYSFALSETRLGYKALAGVAGMTLFIPHAPSFHHSPPPTPHPTREAATDKSCVVWETGTRLGSRLEMHVGQACHCTHAMPQAFPPSLSLTKKRGYYKTRSPLTKRLTVLLRLKKKKSLVWWSPTCKWDRWAGWLPEPLPVPGEKKVTSRTPY